MLFAKRALVPVLLTVIFLTAYSPVQAQDSLAPQVKNPMNEIGFYKDHVYDFKDIVSVDQLSGSATITIPIGSMNGKGVGAFTLSLQYTASASIRIMNVVYHDPTATTVGNWDWRIINTYDEINALSSSELAWHITIPSLDQWVAPTQSVVEPHIYKFNLNSVQYKTMNFVDEQGLNQPLLEVGDDMPMNTGCYMARDSSTKSAPFVFADIDDHSIEGNYSGNIFKVGGISYAGLDNTKLLGGFFGDLLLFVNGTPEPEPTTLPTPTNPGLTDRSFTVTKTDPEGNQLKIESKDINADGHYEEIDYSNNTSRSIHLTGSDGAVSTVISPGMGTTTFEYINVWVNSGYQRFLKTITLEDGSSYQFEYYFIYDAGSGHYEYRHPTFPTPNLSEGNAFINSFEFENAVHETVNKEIYIPMLKKIKLPTGGSIEFRYQVFGCTSDLNGSEVDYHIRLGMKELVYKDAEDAVVEKREYSVFVPVNGVPGPSMSTNDFLSQLKNKMVDSTTFLYPWAITNGFGRRILVLDGADDPISLTDQIYTAKLGSSAPYIDRQARIKQVYSYANPDTALTAINMGSGVTGLERTVTDNEYRMKLASLPAFSDQPGFYPFKYYLVNSVTKKYDGNPDPQLVSTTTNTTQYYGLDNSGTTEDSFSSYVNEDTKALVVPVRSETTVSDGSTTLLDTVSENKYTFLSTPWMARKTASMQTEGSKTWLSKNTYDTAHPWRVYSSTSGPGTDAGGGVWNFNSPTYTVTNTFFDDSDTARKGLLQSRTLTLVGGTGTPSGITEHFDYTAGILTSYKLGDGTLSLLTTRTIDTGTGLVQTQTNPDGTSVSYDWDSSNRLTGIHPKGQDGTPLTATAISYNNYNGSTMANVEVTGPKMAKYYYDGLGRLTYEGTGTYNGKFDWSRVEYDSLEKVGQNWTGLRLASGITPTPTIKNSENKGWGDVAHGKFVLSVYVGRRP